MRTLLCITAVTFIAGALPPTAAEKKEIKKFQGSWQAAFIHQANGKLVPDEELKTTTIHIKGNRFTLKNKGMTFSGTFSVDPTKKPKTINATVTDLNGTKKKIRVLGIYRIKKGRRKSCFALPDQPRPTEIEQKKGYIIFEWKRAKAQS